MLVDSRLTFNKYPENVFEKANSEICIIGKLQPVMSRSALLTVYKLCVSPHLDYGDV